MNRETVIRGIVERDVRQQQLSEEAVREEEPELHRLACEHFGMWETALRYAGVDIRRVEIRYDRKQILYLIRSQVQKRHNLAGVRMQQNHPQIYQAARRHFGTWRQALQAAGVDLRYARLRTRKARRLDKEKIFAELRAWEASGHSLRWCDMCLQNQDLANTAKEIYSNWRKALLAAGVVTEQQMTRGPTLANPRHVSLAIQKRHLAGRSLDERAVREEVVTLLWAARRYFGSWAQALAAAGVPAAETAPESSA